MKLKYPFIVLEGTDGSGKSTIADWIANYYGYKKHKSIGGAFSEVKSNFDIDKVSIQERFSFLCGEAINNSSIAKKELQLGSNIIFDRYYYSTLVYCESLEKGITQEFDFLFDKLVQPDLVIFISTDFENMFERITKRGQLTLIEKRYSDKDNFNTLKLNYRKYLPSNFIEVDNNGRIDETIEAIKKILGKKQ